MSREVRRVPLDWKHPVDREYTHEFGHPLRWRPLFDGRDLAWKTANWDLAAAAWARGEFPDYASDENRAASFEAWDGPRPDPADYMPVWTEVEATHWQMYETCSEGTPISPPMPDPESLARWLVEHRASTFGVQCYATYEQWMQIILGASVYLTWSRDRGTRVEIVGVMGGDR